MTNPDPIIVSYSELSTFRQCPLKHWLAYDLRYTKPPAPTGALSKGTLWHAVMEDHYKLIQAEQNRHPRNRIPPTREKSLLEEIWKSISWRLFDDNGKQTEVQELIEWMYIGYVKQYGADLGWRIDGIERYVEHPLLDTQGRRSHYMLKAKIDLIIFSWETMSLWVVDHKSGANPPTQMDLEIDDQFGLYQWLLRQVGKPVTGSLHSYARTTRNKGDFPDAEAKYKPQTLEGRFKRTFLNRTQTELTNIAQDAWGVARAAYPPASSPRPKYSAPDPRSCGWMCDFKEPHLLMRKGYNIHEVLADYGFRVDKTRH